MLDPISFDELEVLVNGEIIKVDVWKSPHITDGRTMFLIRNETVFKDIFGHSKFAWYLLRPDEPFDATNNLSDYSPMQKEVIGQLLVAIQKRYHPDI